METVYTNRMTESESKDKIVLVTGGSGLVGRAVKKTVENKPEVGCQHVFLTSKDGDLRFFFFKLIPSLNVVLLLTFLLF